MRSFLKWIAAIVSIVIAAVATGVALYYLSQLAGIDLG